MKRELGIARCGLACCLCSENEKCNGCVLGDCPDKNWCENKKCSTEKGISHCYACEEDCKKGILNKIKPYAFTLFVKRYGEEELLNCLAENEKKGIVYHREGFSGDYDNFDDGGEIDHIHQDRGSLKYFLKYTYLVFNLFLNSSESEYPI